MEFDKCNVEFLGREIVKDGYQNKRMIDGKLEMIEGKLEVGP